MFIFPPGHPCSRDRGWWDSSNCPLLLQAWQCRYALVWLEKHLLTCLISFTFQYFACQAQMKNRTFHYENFFHCCPCHPAIAALRAFLQEVASVAQTLPFYYYHIPAVTGVNGQCPWWLLLHFEVSYQHTVKISDHLYWRWRECEMVFFVFLQCWQEMS